MRNHGDVEKYNDIIVHETLRVAVCDALEARHDYHTDLQLVYSINSTSLFQTQSLYCREVKRQTFLSLYSYYSTTASEMAGRLDGRPMMVTLLIIS